MQKHLAKKPLFGTKVYIRDKVLKAAMEDRRNPGKLEVEIQGMGSAVVDVKDWVKTGERMEKIFKIPNRPMILYGNFVPLKQEEGTVVKKPAKKLDEQLKLI